MFESVRFLLNQVPQLSAERDDEYIARMLLAVDRLTDAAWATLPKKVRDWLNAAIKKIDAGSFEGLIET